MLRAFLILFVLAAGAIAAVLVATVILSTGSEAHDAPAGWTYPWACCSGLDCQRVDEVRVHETPDGYVVDGSADTAAIPYLDKRVKDSPDGDFHWCAHQQGADVNKTICLFRPPKGF